MCFVNEKSDLSRFFFDNQSFYLFNSKKPFEKVTNPDKEVFNT
jgi:hypothetical protein